MASNSTTSSIGRCSLGHASATAWAPCPHQAPKKLAAIASRSARPCARSSTPCSIGRDSQKACGCSHSANGTPLCRPCHPHGGDGQRRARPTDLPPPFARIPLKNLGDSSTFSPIDVVHVNSQCLLDSLGYVCYRSTHVYHRRPNRNSPRPFSCANPSATGTRSGTRTLRPI